MGVTKTHTYQPSGRHITYAKTVETDHPKVEVRRDRCSHRGSARCPPQPERRGATVAEQRDTVEGRIDEIKQKKPSEQLASDAD